HGRNLLLAENGEQPGGHIGDGGRGHGSCGPSRQIVDGNRDLAIWRSRKTDSGNNAHHPGEIPQCLLKTWTAVLVPFVVCVMLLAHCSPSRDSTMRAGNSVVRDANFFPETAGLCTLPTGDFFVGWFIPA